MKCTFLSESPNLKRNYKEISDTLKRKRKCEQGGNTLHNNNRGKNSQGRAHSRENSLSTKKENQKWDA